MNYKPRYLYAESGQIRDRFGGDSCRSMMESATLCNRS